MLIFLCTLGITVGAVCVYPSRVEDAVTSLKATGASHVPVASGKYLKTMFAYSFTELHKLLIPSFQILL